PPDLRVQREHLLTVGAAFGTLLEMRKQLRRGIVGVRANSYACFFARHGLSPEDTAPIPYISLSLLRARKRLVRTAGSVRPSPLAISPVENPPSTCSTSGSRYSSGSVNKARRRSAISGSASLSASATSWLVTSSSTLSVGSCFRSCRRAFSRRTMVSNHGRR